MPTPQDLTPRRPRSAQAQPASDVPGPKNPRRHSIAGSWDVRPFGAEPASPTLSSTAASTNDALEPDVQADAAPRASTPASAPRPLEPGPHRLGLPVPPAYDSFLRLQPFLSTSQEVMASYLSAHVQLRVLAPLIAFEPQLMQLRPDVHIEHLMIELPPEVLNIPSLPVLLTFVAQQLAHSWARTAPPPYRHSRQFVPVVAGPDAAPPAVYGRILTTDASLTAHVYASPTRPVLRGFTHHGVLADTKGKASDVLGPPSDLPGEMRVRQLLIDRAHGLMRISSCSTQLDALIGALKERALGFVHAHADDWRLLLDQILGASLDEARTRIHTLIDTIAPPLSMTRTPAQEGKERLLRAAMLLNLAATLAFELDEALKFGMDDPQQGIWRPLMEGLQRLTLGAQYAPLLNGTFDVLAKPHARRGLLVASMLAARTGTHTLDALRAGNKLGWIFEAAAAPHALRVQINQRGAPYIVLPHISVGELKEHVRALAPMPAFALEQAAMLAERLQLLLGIPALEHLGPWRLGERTLDVLPRIARLSALVEADDEAGATSIRLRLALSSALEDAADKVRPTAQEIEAMCSVAPAATPAAAPVTPSIAAPIQVSALAPMAAVARAPETTAAPRSDIRRAAAPASQARRPVDPSPRPGAAPAPTLSTRPPRRAAPAPTRSEAVRGLSPTQIRADGPHAQRPGPRPTPSRPKPGPTPASTASSLPAKPAGGVARIAMPTLVVTAIRPAMAEEQPKATVPHLPPLPDSPEPSSLLERMPSAASSPKPSALPSRAASPVSSHTIRSDGDSDISGHDFDQIIERHGGSGLAAVEAWHRNSPDAAAIGARLTQLLLASVKDAEARARLLGNARLWQALLDCETCEDFALSIYLRQPTDRQDDAGEAFIRRQDEQILARARSYLDAGGDRLQRLGHLHHAIALEQPLYAYVSTEMLRLTQQRNKAEAFAQLLFEHLRHVVSSTRHYELFGELGAEALGLLGRAPQTFRSEVFAVTSPEVAGYLAEAGRQLTQPTRAQSRGTRFVREHLNHMHQQLHVRIEACCGLGPNHPSNTLARLDGLFDDLKAALLGAPELDDNTLQQSLCLFIALCFEHTDAKVAQLAPAIFWEALCIHHRCAHQVATMQLVWSLAARNDNELMRDLLSVAPSSQEALSHCNHLLDAIAMLVGQTLGKDALAISAATQTLPETEPALQDAYGMLIYLRRLDPHANIKLSPEQLLRICTTPEQRTWAMEAEMARRELARPPSELSDGLVMGALPELAAMRKQLSILESDLSMRHTMLCAALQGLIFYGSRALERLPRKKSMACTNLQETMADNPPLVGLFIALQAAMLMRRLGLGRSIEAVLDRLWGSRPDLREAGRRIAEDCLEQQKARDADTPANFDITGVIHSLVRTEERAAKKQELLALWLVARSQLRSPLDSL